MRHPTLPTRNTLRHAQGTALTGQYSYVSDDATDLGSSGFGLMFYQSRWYDPASGRFSQADTIVPGGVQGLDRYAYVNNSPLNYVDPSGHFACRDGQSGYQCRSAYQRRNSANISFRAPAPTSSVVCSSIMCSPMARGMSHFGTLAYYSLFYSGLLGNTQAALEYLVAAEFNYGIVNSNINAKGTTQYSLVQGMTNRFVTFCGGGAWTTKCFNGFWAYHEPVITGKSVDNAFSPYDKNDWVENYGYSQLAIISNIASAIQHPGQSFGSGQEAVTAAPGENGYGGCKSGSQSTNICHYAQISPDSSLRTSFTTWAYGQGMPGVKDNEETYWGLGGLHVWNSYGDLFFVASQAAYDTYGFPVYGQ